MAMWPSMPLPPVNTHNMLLFPGGLAECIAERESAIRRGYRIIGASSLVNDPAVPLYPEWVHLPYVNDSSFEEKFLALVNQETISIVYTRHAVIARYLKQIISQHQLSIMLDATAFAAASIEENNAISKRIDALLAQPLELDIQGQADALSRLARISLLRHAMHIEGQSSDEKIFALMEIFRSCPQGDIVEIGSFWGRSAFVLGMLARHYSIGTVLCIDPWRNDTAHQEGVPAHLNDEAREIDFESAFNGFQINLMPYNTNHINFLRGDSKTIRTKYGPNLNVTSSAFGTTCYTGKISCLHIDGNHGYDAIVRDIHDWLPLVVAGGWVIIDDYQWTFGDGPRQAADEWLAIHQATVARAFVTGSALFIKLA